MKKTLLVLFIAIMTTGLLVAGCGGKSPKAVVEEFTNAMQAGDWEKAAIYVENKDKAAFQEDIEDEEDEKMAKQILAQVTFDVGSTTITGEKAVVDIKVTSLDMVRIVTGMISELMPLALTLAFSEDSQSKMDTMATQYLQNSLSDPEAPKITTDTVVNLIKSNDGWKISADNDAFFDALVGNMGKAFADTSDDDPGSKKEGAGNASAEITQTAMHKWKDGIGSIWVHGAIEIKNTGTVPVQIGDIAISFIGEGDTILGSDTMIASVPNIIKPGDVAYVGDSNILEGISSIDEIIDIEANIDFRETEAESQMLTVEDLNIRTDGYGDFKVTGRVANTSTENADDIRIVIALFNDEGKLLGIKKASPDVTLAPDKKMGFEARYPTIEGGMASEVSTLTGKAYNWSW